MKQLCRLMTLIFCAGLTAFGQAVPSQIGNVQLGNGLGNRGAGDVQVIYAMTGATNHGWNGYLQFNMGVFPALTPAQVQKATLVLYLESGGGPGTVALCEAGTAWSATTITGTHVPNCVAGTTTNIPITSAQLANGAFIPVDVTSIVQSWYNGSANNGFILSGAAVGTNVQFDIVSNVLGYGVGYSPVLNLVLQSQGPQGIQGPVGPVGPIGPMGLLGRWDRWVHWDRAGRRGLRDLRRDGACRERHTLLQPGQLHRRSAGVRLGRWALLPAGGNLHDLGVHLRNWRAE